MDHKDSMNGADPGETLIVTDAVAIIVGIVVGVGIFKTPGIVASSAGGEAMVLLLWVSGGAITLVGALCYAELASAYPHAGGDYQYLQRAFGGAASFLLAWARMMVIQTGSIAMIAFLIGDYASELLHLGRYSASLYAAFAILFLTGINVAGIKQGRWTQRILIGAIMAGLFVVAVLGLAMESSPHFLAEPISSPGMEGTGKAMIFVLLTYGGWNEAAYLSGEVRDAPRNMVRVLLYSIGIITAIYLVLNLALVKGLGLSAMADSEAVAADLMRRAVGENGARFISLLIFLVALSTMNGMVITGARTNYALGKDYTLFRFLGRWKKRRSTPANAILFQGIVSILLVAMGTGNRSGFVMMVEYTAPVFWFFLLLVGVSVFVLRYRDPLARRPFRVPLYPLTPLLFCASCIYMLHSSLAYTGKGALVGIGVLLAGIFLLMIQKNKKNAE